MMNDRPAPRQPLPAGLCDRCLHARTVDSARGSRFVLCSRSRTDPAYPKYPVLPVRHCRGWEAAPLG